MKILQQGHMDGFCLLYAVANAFKALTCPTQTASRFVEEQRNVWRKLVSVTPSLHNFASGKGSCFSTSTEQRFLELCAAAISNRSKESFSVHRITKIEEISESVTENSVVVLALGKEARTKRCTMGDHWICIVDTEDKEFLIACSYTDYLDNKNGNKKKEDDQKKTSGESPCYNRPFNNRITKKELSKKAIGRSLYKFRYEANIRVSGDRESCKP
ncbi:MAG: hypothetical protein FD174_631 [Geobacteraceae bacterium]|nr:MAG: hypothetical protein FD174_631 [Geobacteraceae bacterium]